MASAPPNADQLARRLRAGERASLARAITLVESKRADHQQAAHRLVQELLTETGKAVRVGITGSPGVGKSTTIDALGTCLTAKGHKVAVLAVDPSSTRTGGSILGDKTRMARLAVDPHAFIRPSPAAGTLGGVAAKTRETMLICEAAGFDVILVETVGIGQSETAVADMIAVNKADGDNVKRAKAAAGEYRAALHILTPRSPTWAPPVMTYSALTGDGIEALWTQVLAHRQQLSAVGEFAARRREQQVKWMWSMLQDRFHFALTTNARLRARMPAIERAVADGTLSPALAVEEIAGALGV